MRQGTALVISAPSGTGKSSLCAMLLEKYANLSFSVSCTTRPRRSMETEGKDYYFLDKAGFEKKRKAGEFAEWALVHGNFYGTPIKPVLETLASGRDILFDIDVQGASQLNLALPHAVFIFIAPPSLEELRNRLVKRNTDNHETIELRMKNALSELRSASWYDYLIVNDNLERAFLDLSHIYLAAVTACHCNRDILNRLLSE